MMPSDDEAIVGVLLQATARLEPAARVRHIYNEAIDDAANFLRDLAPHNPMQVLPTLLAAEREVRKLALVSPLEALAREETPHD